MRLELIDICLELNQLIWISIIIYILWIINILLKLEKNVLNI